VQRYGKKHAEESREKYKRCGIHNRMLQPPGVDPAQ
jgi:hypothetical protein